MTESNTAAEHEMQQLGQIQGEQLETAVVRGTQWSEQLVRRGAEGKRLRDGGMKVSFSSSHFGTTGLTSAIGVELREEFHSRWHVRGPGSGLVLNGRLQSGHATHDTGVERHAYPRSVQRAFLCVPIQADSFLQL